MSHHPVFPTLRTRPNDTHASYQLDMNAPILTANGQPIAEKLQKVTIDTGLLTLYTCAGDLNLTHRCYPAKDSRASYEMITVTNIGPLPVDLSADAPICQKIDEQMGPMGMCIAECVHNCPKITLASNQTIQYAIQYCGRYAHQPRPDFTPDEDLNSRNIRREQLTNTLKLDTGVPVLDTLFAFSKLRAGESVFDTRFGKIHSPGGKSYYAATWCNDEAEYAGPYFAYTGDEVLLEASMNAYRMYIPFMSDSYTPIPSSIIAEGLDYWNGAGDRGDAAMYLYGASRFVLTCGRESWARELLPAIHWCAEYCIRRKNEFGVIASDSDELEGRFSSGKMNLNTSCLALAGFRYASILCREMGEADSASRYAAEGEALAAAIDRVFGADIHGYSTYAYHDGCNMLRSWICMPLCVGLYDRTDGTVAALTDHRLLRPDGMLTSEDNHTIWDRSTLYAIRGLYAAGSTEKATECLQVYSAIRLLGDRVPYPVEAYPEGDRRHLSGESALFCKVFTEGLLGLEPEGLRSFTICPRLPESFAHLYMENIHAHGGTFDVRVEKDGYQVIKEDGSVIGKGNLGERITVHI